MRTPVRGLTVLTAIAVLGVSCGNSANSTMPSGANGTDVVTALINGAGFSAHSFGVLATPGLPGLVMPGNIDLTATSIVGGTTMTLSLGFLTGPGTYPFGVGSTTPGGTLQVSSSAYGSGITPW